LEKHLCGVPFGNETFAKVGPSSFFFKDDRNTIFVKVNGENLIIVIDGEEVLDHMEMIFLNIHQYSEDDEEDIFNSYLQNILHKF
jgi:hypothetical protein